VDDVIFSHIHMWCMARLMAERDSSLLLSVSPPADCDLSKQNWAKKLAITCHTQQSWAVEASNALCTGVKSAIIDCFVSCMVWLTTWLCSSEFASEFFIKLSKLTELIVRAVKLLSACAYVKYLSNQTVLLFVYRFHCVMAVIASFWPTSVLGTHSCLKSSLLTVDSCGKYLTYRAIVSALILQPVCVLYNIKHIVLCLLRLCA